jgi:putative oxidoreductase
VLRLAFPRFATGRPALALFVLRVVFGVALVFHGWKKADNPFHWMDGFETPAPEPLQFAAMISELGGGIGLALGLFTPMWCVLLLATMGVALGHHIPHGDAFVAPGKPSWESAAGYFTVALALLFAGPGRWSADFFLFGRRRGEAPPE